MDILLETLFDPLISADLMAYNSYAMVYASLVTKATVLMSTGNTDLLKALDLELEGLFCRM